jgi:hypothetical protein
MSIFKSGRAPRDPKLIIEADEPALFYSSVSRAETDLEAIDVENGVYTAAFGPHGERFRIESDGKLVIISLDEDSPPEPERLKEVLVRFLNAVHVSVDPTESVEELLQKCAPYTE